MIISPSKEFIFIHLEKCGGTSVESSLEPYLAWHDLILGSTTFGEKVQHAYFERFGVEQTKNNMLWKHSAAKEIRYFLGMDEWNSFKKVSVVRDPVQLVVSLYNYCKMVSKYHAGRINPTTWKEKIRIQDYPNHFPFTEKYFIAYVKSIVDDSGINGFVKEILSEDNYFIKPQSERLSVGDFSKLGKVVDLSMLGNEWKNLIDYMGFEEDIQLLHLNQSEKSDEEISPKFVKMIKKHFAIDYQVLPRYTGTTW